VPRICEVIEPLASRIDRAVRLFGGSLLLRFDMSCRHAQTLPIRIQIGALIDETLADLLGLDLFTRDETANGPNRDSEIRRCLVDI
jgi:hypothetical protein